MNRKLTTATLLAAGALFSVGCEHTVFGERSFHSGTVAGTYPKSNVYGDASFHDQDRVSGPTEYGRPPVDRAQAASDRSDRSSRADLATRTDTTTDVPRDEVARSSTATPAQPAPAEQPARTEQPPVRTEQPARADRPTPPAERPSTPPDNDRPLVRNDVKPEVANDSGQKTSPNTPDGRDPEMVARANTARYPDDLKPVDDARLAAHVNAADRTLRFTNHSDHDITGGNLWVNEMYVTPVPSLRPGESTVVQTKQFFNHDGKMLPSLTESSKLQLESAGKLYNVRLTPQDDAQFNK